MSERYLHFDGMCWPNPAAVDDARLGLLSSEAPTRSDLLFASSVLGAYAQLVEDSQARRNAKVSGIRSAAALASLEDADTKGGTTDG